MDTILLLSKRTVSKILKRANAKCSICEWNGASCDIHHIIPKSKNGTDAMNNLICVCPNCHRMIHEHGEKYVAVDKMKKVSLDKTLPNWKDFYNPTPSAIARVCQNNGINYLPCNCKTCGKPVLSHIKYCSDECKFNGRKKFTVTKDELEKLIREMPFTKISKIFDVTDNAVRNRCKRLGIEIPKYPRGYWLKK